MLGNHLTSEEGDFHFKKESYAIRGAAFEVYRELGCGFLESVYQECFESELTHWSIPFVSQPELSIRYKGELIKQAYRPDFVCYGQIIVEIKALSKVTGEHKSQVLNYLKATNFKLGLLINFGAYPKATVERLVL